MKAGSLRHRVIVQEYVETLNSYGESVKTWSELTQVDAAVEPLAGREYFHAQQTKADVTHKVTMRYTPYVAPAMRIVFGTRIFHIASVRNADERGIMLELICKEQL
jgi:SPP1 family predicted phage head-tail adaptor